MEFTGTVNEPATVTVGGNAAEVDASGNFRGTKTVSSGTSTVAVVATDASSNVTTQNYEVTIPSGSSRTLTYDLNGNMTDDGAGKEYEWDAANRLVKIIYGSGGSTEFTYDGFGRRVKIVEKDGSSSVTSDKRFVWVGLAIAEERNSANVVTKRFYDQGVQVPGASSPDDKLFYTRDHLGTIRELIDNAAVVRGRWDYDSYGLRSTNLITTSPLEADFAYTSHFYHHRSELHLAPHRVYDSRTGKWLSRDPIKEDGGVNLYAYVRNSSILLVDPLGLTPEDAYEYLQQVRKDVQRVLDYVEDVEQNGTQYERDGAYKMRNDAYKALDKARDDYNREVNKNSKPPEPKPPEPEPPKAEPPKTDPPSRLSPYLPWNWPWPGLFPPIPLIIIPEPLLDPSYWLPCSEGAVA